MAAWTESTIEIAAQNIYLTRGGNGPPVLVLYRSTISWQSLRM
jgi:hypothetical protein